MHHGIVLSAIDSSTLNSSAMDSSAIGVDVAVLVVCKDLAARYLIFFCFFFCFFLKILYKNSEGQGTGNKVQ